RILPGAGSVYEQAVQFLKPSDNVIYARRVISPDFETNLVLSKNERHVFAMGHVGCTEGEIYRIEATLTQSLTGAMARGNTHGLCTGDLQQWQAETTARGPNRFQQGEALICGVILTLEDNVITDAWQWCKNVTLVSP